MSHENERLHRHQPERGQPIRDYPHYARRYGLGAGDDPVARGVKLGYSVLEEQMREGQKLAERLRGRAGPGGGAGADFGALIERALNVYREFGSLAFAAMEAMARAPAASAAAAPNAPPAAAPAPAPLAIEVKCARRVGVKLALMAPARAPRVAALNPALGDAPPLAGATFVDGPEPALRLEIGEAQPAGLYHGVVVEADSGEPVGTLTVRLQD